MKMNPGFKVHTLFLAAAFLAGPGWVTHASAQELLASYLVDLNTGTATAVGMLGGKNLPYSYDYGINDAGQVVGGVYGADYRFHAFITGPDGAGTTDLGTGM